MQRAVIVVLSLSLLCVAAIGAQQRGESGASSDALGTWSGTWDGAGSGGFELTLEKGEDGKLKGNVSVTGEPTYKATLRTVSLDGNTMSAEYDFPPDPQMEVILKTTFDGKKATGTWTARQKGGTELATGNLNLAKK